MEQFEVKYNRNRFRPPSDEVVKKLILSKEQVEGLKKRPIRCPVCNFRHHDIYEDTVGHVDIKCPKWGYEGTINLAFFRTQTKKLKCLIQCYSKSLYPKSYQPPIMSLYLF